MIMTNLWLSIGNYMHIIKGYCYYKPPTAPVSMILNDLQRHFCYAAIFANTSHFEIVAHT